MKLFVNKQEIPIVIYHTFFQKLIGMMGRRKKAPYGILFPHCNSIHTFFMCQTIDVFMFTKEGILCYSKRNVKPWHIILPKRNAFYTLECSQTLLPHSIDTMEFKKR